MGGLGLRPQASAGTQSSSKQCLLSWRQLGITGQQGCTSIPYVTIKVNALALATRDREVGLKTGSNMRNLLLAHGTSTLLKYL